MGRVGVRPTLDLIRRKASLELMKWVLVFIIVVSPAIMWCQAQNPDQADSLDYAQQSPTSQKTLRARRRIAVPFRCRTRLSRTKKTIPKVSRQSVCSGSFQILQR